MVPMSPGNSLALPLRRSQTEVCCIYRALLSTLSRFWNILTKWHILLHTQLPETGIRGEAVGNVKVL